MPEITANSGLLSKTKVHVDDTGGPGRPVLLIHGWPLSGESWSEQIPALAEAGPNFPAFARARSTADRNKSQVARVDDNEFRRTCSAFVPRPEAATKAVGYAR